VTCRFFAWSPQPRGRSLQSLLRLAWTSPALGVMIAVTVSPRVDDAGKNTGHYHCSQNADISIVA
jgi:hypothetical protein